jgi:hypothetical protein
MELFIHKNFKFELSFNLIFLSTFFFLLKKKNEIKGKNPKPELNKKKISTLKRLSLFEFEFFFYKYRVGKHRPEANLKRQSIV